MAIKLLSGIPKLAKKGWKNPKTKYPKGSKKDLIERIRSLPKKIGGEDIKHFGKKKKKYIKRDPHEGEPSQASDWPYWRGEE